jgi:AraC family transcriptional regulator
VPERKMQMDFLSRMTEVVDYIEDHITEDMDMNDMAKIVCCGVYQFGRIFSYVVGVSLSEYIRRRRLSLAAVELQSGNVRVIDVALKYGYDSPDAFTRAFSALHQVTPKEASTLGVKLRMYRASPSIYQSKEILTWNIASSTWARSSAWAS